MNSDNIVSMKLEQDDKKLASSEKMGTWQDNEIKSYYFLKGYAHGKGYVNMQKALILARQLHKGQLRKGGQEYIVHPLRVCAYLVSLNLEDDILLSAALLHDVVEDVDYIKEFPKALVEEYKLDKEVLDVVLAVTKNIKGMTSKQEELYYDGVKKNWRALLVKLSDRVNNISTMQDFSEEKRMQYIEETKNFILPLCSYGKLYYPELSNVITAIKYQLTSICDSIVLISKQYKTPSETKNE